MIRALRIAGLCFLALAGPVRAEEVGEVGVDWVGNDITFTRKVK